MSFSPPSPPEPPPFPPTPPTLNSPSLPPPSPPPVFGDGPPLPPPPPLAAPPTLPPLSLAGMTLLVKLALLLPVVLIAGGVMLYFFSFLSPSSGGGRGGSSGLNGLYLRLESSYWNGRLSHNERHYYFPDSGRIYDGVPAGGLDNFSWDRVRQAEPRNCGTCGHTSQKFEWKENGFELDGLYNDHVGSFDKGQKLSGGYGASASVGGGGYTYVGSARSLVFKTNGTFTGGAAASFSTAGSSSGREISGGGGSEDSGTYKMTGGNTLELRHADGKTTLHTVYPWGEKGDSKQQPTRMSIDGKLFKLENKNP